MRILGIDVGSSCVKAVEIDSMLGRYEVHDYHEQKLTPGEDPAQGLIRLMASLPKSPDRIAVAMKTGQVTFRTLHFPTRDRKAIQAGVGFELEDELPFPSDESAYDYSILSLGKHGTQVHVAATLEKYVTASIEQWKAANINPDLITTEAWAYRTLLNKVLSPAQQEQPVLIAQIGHERTTIYVHWRGAPILAREINWGGRDLTMAICQKYNIPLDQAEQAKLDHGFVIPPDQHSQATPEQQEFSDTLMQPLQTFLWELRQTELTTKSTTHIRISTIYLSGGTALLPGIGRVAESAIGIPVKHLHGLSSIATSGVTYSEQTDATFLLSASLALCMVGAERSTVINFRKGAFARQGKPRELSLSRLKKPLMATALMLFCVFVSLTAQSMVYRQKLAATQEQLEKTVKSFFGTASSGAVRTYLANTSTLRSSVKGELEKQRELSSLLAPNPHSPINLLKTLSASVSNDTVVDLIEFRAGAATTAPYSATDETTTTLTFLVANPQTAEKLNSALSSRFSDLQRGQMEEGSPSQGGAKRWKVTFSGKPKEDSYGK